MLHSIEEKQAKVAEILASSNKSSAKLQSIRDYLEEQKRLENPGTMVHVDDLNQFLQKFIGAVKATNETFSTASEENIQEIRNALAYIHSQHSSIVSKVDVKAEQIYKDVEALIAECKSVLPQDGRDGKDADEKKIVANVLAQIKIPKPKVDDAEQIKAKLQTLKTAWIELSHIQGLQELINETGTTFLQQARGFVPNALTALYDTDIKDQTEGQAIVWDATKRKWVAGAAISSSSNGGGSSSTGEVYDVHNERAQGPGTTRQVTNEVVAGAATTFTLASTPLLGSEIVYALGQRLTPTTDYTISGAVITTVSSWSAGNILADYEATSSTIFTLAGSPVLGSVVLYAQGQRLYEGQDYTTLDNLIITFNTWGAGEILAEYSVGTYSGFNKNEIPLGTGTLFELDESPTAGTVAVYALGQRLTPTTDYTISGTDITTVNSWLPGDILVDYATRNSPRETYNEIVSGSATTFTLNDSPITNSLHLYALGQRLYPAIDYTIADTVITTVNSWGAGELIADYLTGSAATYPVTFVDNEVVAGSGTSFTLANTPERKTLALYGLGQRLRFITDYIVTGTAVTTVNSWSAGEITTDYTTDEEESYKNNEVVFGTGTSFKLKETPIASLVKLYALGQRLVPTTDYTIADAEITTVSTWSAGELQSDYITEDNDGFVQNEIVLGSGTTFTLAHTPISGSVNVYAQGQRLKLTTDYTISNSIITTINNWSAGNILADYRT